jgi:hypothetical protein
MAPLRCFVVFAGALLARLPAAAQCPVKPIPLVVVFGAAYESLTTSLGIRE